MLMNRLEREANRQWMIEDGVSILVVIILVVNEVIHAKASSYQIRKMSHWFKNIALLLRISNQYY